MAEPIEAARDWLMQLGARIAPTIDEREFTGRVAILAEDLAEEYPPSMLCRSSMLFVARQCRFWPNFAELCEHLVAWKRSQNPYPIWGSEAEAELLAMIPPERRIERDPEKRGAQNDAQRQQASQLVRGVVAQLREIGEAKQDAMRAQLPPRPQAMPLSRAQLVEAYRQAGVKGPQITEPQAEVVSFRAAASSIPSEVRRSPPIDGEPPDA